MMNEASQMGWTLEAITAALGDQLVQINGQTTSSMTKVVTDSRMIERGCIFVALKGEKFDGHDFACKALTDGAAAVVLDHTVGAQGVEIIVRDTAVAYGALASAWRAQFAIPLIAVVGANGKTTTTQMIAEILKAAVGANRMIATEKNFNNRVGVPQTLLRLNANTAVAVVEAGISHPGEMAELVHWIRLTVVVITNAQREHQEFLDGVEASARENGLAIVSLSAKGVAVLPASDACLPIWLDLARARGCNILTYGAQGAGHVQVKGDATSLVLESPQGQDAITLNLQGIHAWHDAAAAASATMAAGVKTSAIIAGLKAFFPVKGRGTTHHLSNGTLLIDETYNANPDSMRASIDVLSTLPHPQILVVGDMGEVGEKATQFHAEIGRYAKEKGIDTLLATGQNMQNAVNAFGVGAKHFANAAVLTENLKERLRERSSVVVKASHFMHFERVVEAVVESQN